MKNQFKAGDCVGTNGTTIASAPRVSTDGDMQGIILNMTPITMPEPWQNNEPVTSWRLTLYITRNGASSETFRKFYAVNTVQTLQIIDLTRWSKL